MATALKKDSRPRPAKIIKGDAQYATQNIISLPSSVLLKSIHHNEGLYTVAIDLYGPPKNNQKEQEVNACLSATTHVIGRLQEERNWPATTILSALDSWRKNLLAFINKLHPTDRLNSQENYLTNHIEYEGKEAARSAFTHVSKNKTFKAGMEEIVERAAALVSEHNPTITPEMLSNLRLAINQALMPVTVPPAISQINAFEKELTEAEISTLMELAKEHQWKDRAEDDLRSPFDWLWDNYRPLLAVVRLNHLAKADPELTQAIRTRLTRAKNDPTKIPPWFNLHFETPSPLSQIVDVGQKKSIKQDILREAERERKAAYRSRKSKLDM